MGRPEYIAILSMSYSGSTMTCSIFGNSPGTVGIGEAHWIVDEPRLKKAKGFGAHCILCGKDNCPVIDKLPRKDLSDANLYPRLRKFTKAKTLVTSDKSTGYYERFLPSMGEKTAAVVLFKRPEAMARSNHLHGNEWGARLDPGAYAMAYDHRLVFAQNRFSRHIVVEYEQLAAKPGVVFQRMCKALELPEATGPVLLPPERGRHQTCGNGRTFKDPRYRNRPIIVDDRWKEDLPKDELRAIQKHEACQRVWRKLRRLAV
jgi:hypothetical protein